MNKRLEIRDVTVHYGKSLAIKDVSLKVLEESIVSIIGANGSGKSTILMALTGLVPEGPQLFPYLSVLNNLKLSAGLRKYKGGIDRALGVENAGCAVIP